MFPCSPSHSWLNSCRRNVLLYSFCKLLLSHPFHFLSHVFLSTSKYFVLRLFGISLRNLLSLLLNGSYLPHLRMVSLYQPPFFGPFVPFQSSEKMKGADVRYEVQPGRAMFTHAGECTTWEVYMQDLTLNARGLYKGECAAKP